MSANDMVAIQTFGLVFLEGAEVVVRIQHADFERAERDHLAAS